MEPEYESPSSFSFPFCIGCTDGEFLYIFFKSRLGRAGGVALMPETPVTLSGNWASFVDSRGRSWDVPRDNIGAIIHKKIERRTPKGSWNTPLPAIWEPATND